MTKQEIIISNNISESLKHLYDASNYMQGTSKVRNLCTIDELAYLKEYCTIKMQAPRQTGNTQAIVSLLDHVEGDWLIISYNSGLRQNVHDRFLKYSQNKIRKSIYDYILCDTVNVFFGSIHSINNIITNNLGLNAFNGVIVDVSCMLKKKQIKEIYKMTQIMNREKRFFVFVG